MKVGHIIATESGRLFSIGFNPSTGRADPRLICWADSQSTWTVTQHNDAGDLYTPVDVAPADFIRVKGEDIAIYRPGLCIELTYVGAPFIYQATVLRPEE